MQSTSLPPQLDDLTDDECARLLMTDGLRNPADVLATVPDPRSRHGRRYDLPFLLTCLVAAMLCKEKQTERCAYGGAIEVQRATLGAPLPPIEQLRHDHYVSVAQETLDAAQCDASWKAGRDMTLEDATQYAVDSHNASE